LRLGLRLVRGLGEEEAARITAAVGAHGPFGSIAALWRASGARVSTLRHLAAADAFGSMGLDRQAALWEIRALRDEEKDPGSLFGGCASEGAGEGRKRDPGSFSLPRIPAPRKVIQDYAAIGLSLKAHPVSFLRGHLAARGAVPAAQLADARLWPHGSRAAVAGMVLVRQRPGTASGIVFMTLEDETGTANLIVRPPVYERYRRAARHGVIVLARGRVERQGEVVHLLAESIESAEQELGGLLVQSHDFH
jgi:error-prone DNA polymerase